MKGEPEATIATMPARPDSLESAAEAGLVYVTAENHGLRRIRAGNGFRYVGEGNRAIRDPRQLRRIRSLAIPPGWTDVWICPIDEGHLQATGRDARGRKQHLYHPLWREVRDATKYDRVIEFARTLPKIRRKVARDMQGKGLGRERVLATVVRLMDLTFLRVGNEEYARHNNSYGLTTLKDKHATVRGRTIRFCFRGKSGKEHEIELADERLAKIVKGCQDIPGQELFQYYGEDGQRRSITSRDVNEYLREAAGAECTARDFRTWAGTVLAMQALQEIGFSDNGRMKKNMTRAVERVASRLGNTPGVCRKCYIHPLVIERYSDGTLPDASRNGVRPHRPPPMTSLNAQEKAALEFLRCCRCSAAATAKHSNAATTKGRTA